MELARRSAAADLTVVENAEVEMDEQSVTGKKSSFLVIFIRIRLFYFEISRHLINEYYDPVDQ